MRRQFRIGVPIQFHSNPFGDTDDRKQRRKRRPKRVKIGETPFSIDILNSGSSQVFAGPGNDYPVVAQLARGVAVNVNGCLNDYSWCDVSIGANAMLTYLSASSASPTQMATGTTRAGSMLRFGSTQ